MDPSSALDEIKSRIAEDGKIHPDAERLLDGYKTKLQNPENLSYRGGKGIVSQMESDIEGLKSQGKFGDARDLFLVKNQIDNSADNFARTGLKNDPAGLALMDQDSEWFKKKVLPYQDPDGGISKMMNGTDADIATKPLFRDSSPDQFGRIFGLLDGKGQAAVRAEIVGHSGETRMKNFQSMNIPSVATYLENHAEQIGTAFGNDNTMGGLDNLIRNTPRAGYQSNLNQALNAASVGKVVTGKGIISKADAAVGGIVDKGLNAIRVPKLFNPNLADYAGPITPTPSAPTALGYGLPTLGDSSATPSQPPQAMPYTRALGMYPTGESTGLVTRGMIQLPEYRPPTPLGGPTAINPQTPTLAPYAQSLGQMNGPVYPPAQRMQLKVLPKGLMGIAQPTSMAEYEALPPGTPYQSVSGAKGIKP
jgi:hypothetical protein